MTRFMSRKMTMCSKLAAAALMLAAISTGAVANDTPGDMGLPAVPQLAWNETDQQLIAFVPPEVQAWMEGELADENDRFASWKARHDMARSRPEFAQALGMLQAMIQQQATDRDLGRFEIEHELLPTLLRERPDLARALAGEDVATPMGAPSCYMVQTGRAFCARRVWLSCKEWGCDTTSEETSCTETTPIPCPPASLIIDIE